MKKLFFLLLTLLSFSAQSQDLEDKVLSEKKLLHDKGVDTIIRFDNEYLHIPEKYKISGLGKMVVMQEAYLFYKFRGIGMVSKCIYYGDTSGFNVDVAVLNAIKLNCDSLFEFAAFNLDKFKQEKIYPFVYKRKQGYDSVFNILSVSHPSNFVVEINFKKESFRKSLTLDNIEERKLDLKNLNYAYNSNTTIYQIFLMIQGMIKPIEKSFSYGN